MCQSKYRSLELECRIQAALTWDEQTKEELEKMRREYKVIADWLEARQQAVQRAASAEWNNGASASAPRSTAKPV